MEQKMSKKPRRKHSPASKAKVALADLAGDKTLTQLDPGIRGSSKSDYRLEKQMAERAAGVYGKPTEPKAPPVVLQNIQQITFDTLTQAEALRLRKNARR
ncbi:hypothetical protein [Methylomonas aurea]|uniref:hypothetical protein n=2 Tax=Methylomonas TaxID=416 RepID=UPI003532393E